MGTTSPDGLPYPESTSSAYVHLDIKSLADAVQAEVTALTAADTALDNRADVTQLLQQDSGFPLVAVSETLEFTVSRITVPATPLTRRVTAQAAVFVNYTQANDVDLILYIGASVMGRNRKRMIGGVGEVIVATSNAVTIAAGASAVLEARVVRAAGTGAIATSSSSGLTTFAAQLAPA